jgi:uncharacterized protein (TIGR01244 family)
MTDFRQVTDSYAVSPQIELGDIAKAKADGFVMVINNRPDGEAPDQPSTAQMEAAAKEAGLSRDEIVEKGSAAGYDLSGVV